jgi:hypothetical protein
MAEPNSAGLSGGAVALLTGLVGAVAGFRGAAATAWFGFASKDEELRVHLVEIAIGILRADPKEDVSPARGWAIDIIEQKSGVKFSPVDRAALLHKPLLDKNGVKFLSPSGGVFEKFIDDMSNKDAPAK